MKPPPSPTTPAATGSPARIRSTAPPGDAFKFTDFVDFIPEDSELGMAVNAIPTLNGSYNDPTEERIIEGATNQVGQTTEYTYLDTNRTPGSRVMTSIVVNDGTGAEQRAIQYDVTPATGNRTRERVYTGVAGVNLVRDSPAPQLHRIGI